MRHFLGRVVVTLPHEVITALLNRHAARDWSDLDANDYAGINVDYRHAGGPLFSRYDNPEHGTVLVITEDLNIEAGGPITTLLFHEDY